MVWCQTFGNSLIIEGRVVPVTVQCTLSVVMHTQTHWRISSNDSDGNEELGVQPYLPETNTEGNADITVLFYEITERVEFKKTQNKHRHNEKGLMFLCLSCQDIKSDTMFY